MKKLIIIEGHTLEKTRDGLKEILAVYEEQSLPVEYIEARNKTFAETTKIIKAVCTEGPENCVLLFAGNNLNMLQYSQKIARKRIDADKLFGTTGQLTDLWTKSESKKESDMIQMALGAILSITEGYEMKRFVPA